VKRTRCNLALALLALAAAGSCRGDGGTDPEPRAEPGVLTVALATPNSGDRAIVVTVSGPAIASVEAGSTAYVAHSRTVSGSVRAAVFGPLASGPLLRIQVPDVAKAAAYSATVVEVSDAGNALRDLAGYTLSVAK
jgi:hypothetical protein